MDWSPNSKENYGKNYRHGVYGGLAQPNLYTTVKNYFANTGNVEKEVQR